ncbi:MAG: hypothetical protein QM578_23840 [Pantoea sp.]|uniref:hypothetical protein n=1 Tax=unclassified Pantoea TaxID=2630326 RepID=UPI0001B3FDCD|nr:hypothetical protein [Pantoea sp. At-9b]ADU72222.1 conserved hypothetical protein [Pantoea sp. At-9b]
MAGRIFYAKIRGMIIAFAGCMLVTGALFTDIFVLADEVKESSVTEIMQELILLTIASLLMRRAVEDKAHRPALILMAGFFIVLLIRELDFAFDLLAHGSWLWFALAVSFYSLYQAFRHGQQTLAGLIDFMCRPPWGMMCAGMLTVLIFSRFFGMDELWRQIAGESYPRVVKNLAEEGTELFGYMLCLLSTHDYLRELKTDDLPQPRGHLYGGTDR